MLAADGDIALVTANHHLLTGVHRLAVFIQPQHHIGFAPTVTDGFQFHQLIGPGQQILAAGKQLTEKIGTQAVAQYGNVQLVHHITQLLNLRLGQELAFIQQYTMHRLLLMLLLNHGVQHRVVVIELGLRG